MRKIPTIFLRDYSNPPKAPIIDQWKPECLWVPRGEGIATRKFDGTSCAVMDGRLFKRREVRKGDTTPENFIEVEYDDTTGGVFGWVPVSADSPDDKYFREAFDLTFKEGSSVTELKNGTYELCGPKVQGNKDKVQCHMLLEHGAVELRHVPSEYEALREYLAVNPFEGIVWHHPDGRMAKIKRKDFGLKW